MKFVLENLKSGYRVGRIIEVKNGTEKTIATPACLLYTRGGNAPYLTGSLRQQIQSAPRCFHFPIPTIIDGLEGLTEYGKGLTKFAVVDDSCDISYLSCQDPAIAVPEGYNNKSGTAVWSKGGKIKLDVDMFMKIQAAAKPGIYQALCDGDTNRESSRKRLQKSVERTLTFLDKCIELQNYDQTLKGTSIFGSIVGGYSEDERVRCVKETIKRPVDGFCIDGFHNFGPASENVDFSPISDVLQATLAVLPDRKPRLMHHIWAPDKVLLGIKAGLDLFDSSYTHLVTERGGGLVFTFCLPQKETTEPNPEVSEKSGHQNSVTYEKGYEIDLSDQKYKDDFGPIVEGCTCFTCKNHTRSYICHLLNTKEILAGVLLTMHNVHHYSSFFEVIRSAIDANRFEEMQYIIEQQKIS